MVSNDAEYLEEQYMYMLHRHYERYVFAISLFACHTCTWTEIHKTTFSVYRFRFILSEDIYESKSKFSNIKRMKLLSFTCLSKKTRVFFYVFFNNCIETGLSISLKFGVLKRTYYELKYQVI